MNSIMVVAMGAGLAALMGAAAASYLSGRLRRILVELCGTDARADFWRSFSTLVLVMSPVVLALFGADLDCAAPGRAVFYEFRWGAFGLLCSVIGLGLTLSRYAEGAPR